MHDLLDKEDKEVSLTFGKGLSVIMAFEGRNRDLTISEIAEKVSLNRAVARRLVRTLEQLGFVSHERGRYQLTPRVLRLSRGFLETRSIPQVVQPVLRNVSHEIGESVSFAMQDGDEAVYVAHAFVPSRFSLNMVTVGSRVPFAPTAIGRAILAFLDETERAAILERLGLTPYTSHTVVERQALNDLLNSVRMTGFSFSESEYVEGVSSVALPVFDRGAHVVGAVSIIFPQGQYNERELHDRIVSKLHRCAADIGAVF
ncbi:helix-turn-helix domain-containing protein [Chelativorans sp. ZYF759]|uniref:IclR family transcriptional regulator n=1 Tax=Chelativorans sp. ZYF759 TaxID=2692213 RepID=UPI00145C6EB4|nr:IclR family transcriptional regulator C-terminal domain-containing protein [Chelativorans sp. ZYF759]NMG41865.1 helix-turn-helix domain-containing protein [Chelativorans sp. ZYF759]